MVTKVIMPKFGLSMETGIIGSWMAEEGDKVEKGSALAEITTDKISNTCEAPVDGYLRKILLPEGEEAPCGDVIAYMADSMDEPVEEGAAPVEEAAPAAVETPVAATPASAPAAEIRITPRAKKVADEKNLAYEHIQGTGRLGAITIEDLKKYGRPRTEAVPAAETPKAAPAPAAAAPVAAPASAVSVKPVYDTAPCNGDDVIVKMTSMESTIAKAMYTSLQTTAQTTIATEANITNLVKVYKQLKGKYTNAGVKLSYTAMLIKAVAMALENHKALRSTMADENHIKINSRIHIGVAVDVPNGLVVPVIRDANMKDLRTICLELASLTEKAKNNGLTADDMGGATITITNLGMFGITYFTPVLNAPESAILGVGAIVEKLLVKDGNFGVGSVMNFSLTHDHRIINGAPARFLKEVIDSLQEFKWV